MNDIISSRTVHRAPQPAPHSQPTTLRIIAWHNSSIRRIILRQDTETLRHAPPPPTAPQYPHRCGTASHRKAAKSQHLNNSAASTPWIRRQQQCNDSSSDSAKQSNATRRDEATTQRKAVQYACRQVGRQAGRQAACAQHLTYQPTKPTNEPTNEATNEATTANGERRRRPTTDGRRKQRWTVTTKEGRNERAERACVHACVRTQVFVCACGQHLCCCCAVM